MTATRAVFDPVPLPDRRERSVAEMRAAARDFHREALRLHTVRDFDTRPVPRDITETCILAAATAPNGANLQPCHFAVIGDPARKARIRAAAEAEEAAFYAGRAGAVWLAALRPLGTDAEKPFLRIQIASFL